MVGILNALHKLLFQQFLVVWGIMSQVVTQKKTPENDGQSVDALVPPTLTRNYDPIFQKTDSQSWREATGAEYRSFVKFVETQLAKHFSIRDPNMVDSVASRAFCNICKGIDEERLSPKGVASFAVTVVLNAARDEYRRSISHGWGDLKLVTDVSASHLAEDTGTVLDNLQPMKLKSDPQPLDLVIEEEEKGELRAAINQLKAPNLKGVGEAILNGAETNQEIADSSGMSISSMKRYRAELFELLRSVLNYRAS